MRTSLFIPLLLCTSSAMAESADRLAAATGDYAFTASSTQSHAQASSHTGNAEHAPHGHHHFSVFLGNTHIEEEGDGATVGLDYEYRISEVFGIGAVAEYAAGHVDAWTVLAVADIHFKHVILQVGPGFEHTSEHDLFVARLGALYEFEFDNLTISPQVHYDYHDGGEDAVVVGVAFGFHF